MAKLAWLLVLVLLAWRLIFGFWPWDHLRRDSRAVRLARAQKLLGLHRNATEADVLAAHRRLVAQVHPDRGGLAEQVHEADAARDVLLAELPKHTKE